MADPIKYKCAVCKGEFTSGWTDSEAKKELEQQFPGFKPEDCEILCDVCYNLQGALDVDS